MAKDKLFKTFSLDYRGIIEHAVRETLLTERLKKSRTKTAICGDDEVKVLCDKILMDLFEEGWKGNHG